MLFVLLKHCSRIGRQLCAFTCVPLAGGEVLAACSVLARVNENEKAHSEAIRLFRRCWEGYCALGQQTSDLALD